MSIHRAKYLIAAAALSVATLLPAGTSAATVADDACTESARWTASPAAVPKVRGLSLREAADRLRGAGYNCKIVNNNFVQVDTRVVVVIEQEVQYTRDPDGGYSVVALTRGVVMPDLVGLTLAAAEKIAARRAIAVRTSPATGAADWTVKLQNPAAGAYMWFGEQAGLTLSEPVPPEPALVPVPDLIDHTEDEAAAMVKDAGLVYTERVLKDGKRPGRVVAQRPQPGELVERAATVRADVRRVPTPPSPPPSPPPPSPLPSPLPSPPTTTVPPTSTAPPTRAPNQKLVPVPDLLNRSEGEARGAVEGVELIFDPVDGSDTSGRERQVISQLPRAGELVPTGTTVTVAFAADESNLPSWLVPLLLGTAVLAVGAVGRFRHPRGPNPPDRSVPRIQAAGRLTPGVPRIHESGPAHRIRVNARLDRGRQYLQEKTDEHQ